MNTESDSDSDNNETNKEIEEDVTEEERQEIRMKLSNMSFEDLLKMREEVGSKVYNSTVFGVSHTKKKNHFKRANKNRPREMSSKLRTKTLSSTVIPTKKHIPRDPRFDPLCGTFDDETFKSNYKFLHDVRKKEKVQLEKEYKSTTDPERKNKIKYLLQRMENQIREQEKLDKEHKKIQEEKNDIKNKLKKGEKPVFKKKSVKRLENLIEKYEELKKTNKLQKHIEKRTKKLSQKERRLLKQTPE